MDNIKQFIKEIESEYSLNTKERNIVKLKKGQVIKRDDGYFGIAVKSNGTLREAIVPEDTIRRMLEEGISPRVLKDRCNTLSALGKDWDKPLMYYAIVAYNLVPEAEWKKWSNSNALLEYELIHLNGNIDDIRKDNVRITRKDKKLWKEIKNEFKERNITGADKKYTEQREEYFRNRYSEYPELKVMTRVTDVVKKVKKHNEEEYDNSCEEMVEKYE